MTTRQLSILIRALRREGVAEYREGTLCLRFFNEPSPNSARTSVEATEVDDEPTPDDFEGHPSEHLARYYDEQRKAAEQARPRRKAAS